METVPPVIPVLAPTVLSKPLPPHVIPVVVSCRGYDEPTVSLSLDQPFGFSVIVGRKDRTSSSPWFRKGEEEPESYR
jgi:hypothetical protein